MQRIVLLNVRLIVQNYQSRNVLEKHGPMYDPRHKKSEVKKKRKEKQN